MAPPGWAPLYILRLHAKFIYFWDTNPRLPAIKKKERGEKGVQLLTKLLNYLTTYTNIVS